ncbi:hypothetical protein M514_06503 [Trichuris suis]|uniref:Uncharacterized protein n=1 Tax=Trichuris suis TaxID=68888 RepID=A0A085N2Z2_9BILA|nr:hypothetical protein M514_06503 [Trichuris suis]
MEKAELQEQVGALEPKGELEREQRTFQQKGGVPTNLVHPKEEKFSVPMSNQVSDTLRKTEISQKTRG